jgi:hypothetical protein
MMKEVKAHYNTYPSTPEGFEAWQAETVRLIELGHKKIGA